MTVNNLYNDSTIIDGLLISKWGPETFKAMHQSGITAANCTFSVWENFYDSMINIGQWKEWFKDYSDIIRPVYTVNDIFKAKKEGKVGIILGWQNTSGFDDHLPNVSLFSELGLRVVQLTYNTTNSVGSGCYETNDGGLTDFGRELIHELNENGILIDLSHVGTKTAHEAVLASGKPVTYSHCCPSGMKKHPRNKSDEELKHVVEHGGMVGVTMFPPLLKNGSKATISDYIETIEYVINIVGEDHVGIGTDFTQGQDKNFFDFITRDKGKYRKLVDFGDITFPKGFQKIEDTPNLVTAMQQHHWKESRIRKVMGENWTRIFQDVWTV